MIDMTKALINLDARVERGISNVAKTEGKGAGAMAADQIKAQKSVDELLAMASVALAALKLPQIVGSKVDFVV
jgi:hypothetical protein